LIFQFFFFAVLLTSCTLSPFSSTTPPSDHTPSASSIYAFDDVRWLSLEVYQGRLGRSIIQTLWFNEHTTWPNTKDEEIAQDLLEKGKNPGLGINSLHKQGITGTGVVMAIIDQNLLLDHPEFAGKIIAYRDFGTETSITEGSMHAPAVTSLLVGETIGTAPGARLYFAAVPSWTLDSQYAADALNWIVDENSKLADEDRIRAVSVSAALSGPESQFHNAQAWDAAYQRATDAGILVLDCSRDRGIAAPCFLDLDDPENPAKCKPGWPNDQESPYPDHLHVPTSRRTTAEEYQVGTYSYQYTGVGGMSWAIPYLAGVLAMGWQVNPELSNEDILRLLFSTAYESEQNAKIINPVAFIQIVKTTVH
jgi:subtilisin family serine protease